MLLCSGGVNSAVLFGGECHLSVNLGLAFKVVRVCMCLCMCVYVCACVYVCECIIMCYYIHIQY